MSSPSTNLFAAGHAPRHVAIIMDGNGRWAKQRHLPRVEGHRRGVQRVRDVLEVARDHGIEALTLFAFSAENWNRPDDEIAALMDLLESFLDQEMNRLLENGIRFRAVGSPEELPESVQAKLREAEERTRHFDEHTLALALNYGSRGEIVHAMRAYAEAVSRGEETPAELDYDRVRSYLHTADLPDPDLLIRTSGEARLSNFLLLQCAYAELVFSPTLWPDFDRAAFEGALADFAGRERRYGKTTEQLRESAISPGPS